jgi:23S rRNA (uracil1939-C5)-methyltransferase
MSSSVVKISALSHDGRGISHINGKTTFVFGALPGEEVEISYLRRHKNFDEAQATKILMESPERQTPVCPHFGVCGGCTLQHLKEDAQRQHKESVLLEQLQHIGKVKPKKILPALTGPIWNYRYKARLAVKYVPAKERVLVGFHELKGRYVADNRVCPVMHPSVGQHLPLLSDLIAKLSIYTAIPQIEVAVDDTKTALLIRHLENFSPEDLEHLRQFAQTQNFWLYLQPGKMDSVHALWPEDLGKMPLLAYELPDQGVKIHFQPNDFTQINPFINRAMMQQALQLLELTKEDSVLDLFCGVGNFTLPLSRYCKNIVGVEGEAKLVSRATANALQNHIENSEFFCADLAKDCGIAPWTRKHFDKIILDPPRTGAWDVLPLVMQFKPSLILYVSCNPATLSRDAGFICDQNYELVAAGIMDMFPHTSHVESMALFKRKK